MNIMYCYDSATDSGEIFFGFPSLIIDTEGGKLGRETCSKWTRVGLEPGPLQLELEGHQC